MMSQFESRENMVHLISSICAKYNLDPSLEYNIVNIKAYLAPLDASKLLSKHKTIDQTNAAIINAYGDKISSSKRNTIPENAKRIRDRLEAIIKIPGDNPINLANSYKDTFGDKKEGMTDSASSLLSMSATDRINYIRYTNYESLMRDEYIFVDSRYQNLVNSDPAKLAFNLVLSSKTRSDNGGIIVGNNIKDIVRVQVSAFTIPYNSRFANYYNKITMTINEWVSNSYEAYEGGQFHFIFDIAKIDNNSIHLTPVDAVYTFSKPMNYIDNFTISFGGMLTKLEFDKDRQYVSSIDFTNRYGLMKFSEPHKLVTGDLVYITGFTTTDVARDVDLISEVNRASGHIIVKKDVYSFMINVDLSRARRMDPPNSNIYPIDTFKQTMLVFFASKRVQIPLRITYLTNYN